MLIAHLLRMLHHPASNDSLEGSFCPSLVMIINVRLNQIIQENVNDNFFLFMLNLFFFQFCNINVEKHILQPPEVFRNYHCLSRR